ncbi:hypothetical protein [Aeromonas veronii]|uniref:hypothetical protein n=1 Tax=Aeromonas veronii TaxID=654 RepID=UPI003D25C993
MALKTIQAAALAVSLTMNSAQFTAAMNKAVATGNSAKAGLIKAFNAIASGAKSMGSAVGAAAGGIGGVLKGAGVAALAAVAGIVAYTGAVVANRLEAKRLADQYKVTWRQAQQMSYIASAAGFELEDYLDAMKEVSIKAGDVVEGGGGVTNTMSAFFKRTSMSAAEWAGENDPIKKFDALHKAFESLDDAQKVRVLDEMGDAGLKLGASLRMSTEQLKQLKETGEATGSVMDINAIQEAQSKFSYMIRVGNDFLTGIIGELAPVFTATMNSLINTMTSAFKAKGGFKEGFQSYVDDWSDKIFNFLMDTISAVASFVDLLRNATHSMVNGFNSTRDFFGQSMTANFSKSDLNESQAQRLKAAEDKLRALQKAEIEKDIAQKKMDSVRESTPTFLPSDEDKARSKVAVDELIAKKHAVAELSGALEEHNTLIKEYNQLADLKRDPNAASDTASNWRKQFESAKALADKNKASSQAAEDQSPNKPKPKSLISDVADAADAAKAASSKQDKALSEYQKKLKDQYERIAEIKERYRKDDRGAWQKQTQAELDDVNEGFRAARTIIEDGYNRQLEDAKGNLKLQAELKAKMNKEIVENEKQTQEAIKWLQDQQHQRFIEQQDEVLKQLRRNHEAKMRDLGARGVDSIKGGSVGLMNRNKQAELDMTQDYNDQLEQLEKDGYDKQSKAYQELQDQKLEALKAFHEKAKNEELAYGEGAMHQANRIAGSISEGNLNAYRERESVVEGYTNAEIEMMVSKADTIKGNDAASIQKRKELDEQASMAQMKFMADGTSQMIGQLAKRNKAAFVLQKALALAEIAINTMMGAASCVAMGPAGLPMIPMIYALGATQAATVVATAFMPQAHDGVDEVTNGGKREGTWLLETGERVVDKRTNQDLKQALKSGSMSQRAGSTTTISAPLNIPAGTLIDEGGMQELLSKHVKHITKIVDQQKSDRGY